MPSEIDDLLDTSALVSKVAWADRPGASVGEGIEGLCRARNMQDGAMVEAVLAFAAKSEHRVEGHPSPVGWLQHHCRTKRGAARRIWRIARASRPFPAARAALLAGDIGLDHVQVLADAYQDKFAEAWAEAEPLLVDAAVRMRFEDFARKVRYFVDRLDPHDDDERAERLLEDRFLTKASTLDGVGVLHAELDPFSFAVVSDEIDRLEHELFEADWAEAKARLGRDPLPAELARRPGQRRADALREMAERSKAHAGGDVASSVCLVLHMDWATYAAELARLEGRDVTVPGERLCELDDGTVIPASLALSAALAGHVRRIVFGPDDEILNFGRARRFFSGPQRAALQAKYRRCTHPYGCDRTGPLLQMDHTTEWEDHGQTNINDGTPQCGPHNRWKTRHKHDPPRPDTRRDDGQRRGPPG